MSVLVESCKHYHTSLLRLRHLDPPNGKWGLDAYQSPPEPSSFVSMVKNLDMKGGGDGRGERARIGKNDLLIIFSFFVFLFFWI